MNRKKFALSYWMKFDDLYIIDDEKNEVQFKEGTPKEVLDSYNLFKEHSGYVKKDNV